MKSLLLTFTTALFFSLLSGCGGGGDQATQPTTSTSTTLPISIQHALESGEVGDVSEAILLQTLRSELDSYKEGDQLLKLLYNDDNISYEPTNNSQFITLYGDKKQIFPIIFGSSAHTLAAAGYKNNTRVALFGSIPMYFFQRDLNMNYQQPMQHLIQWLLYGETLQGDESNITIALSFANAPNDTINWLHTTFPSYTIKECNDIATHATCLEGVSLIIQGSDADNTNAQTILDNLDKSITTDHIPFLYLHPNWGVNETAQLISEYFDFSMPYGGNWWANDAASWNNYQEMQTFLFSSYEYNSIETLIQHFQNKDFSFDWSQCDGENCSLVTNFNSDFLDGATKVQTIFETLDNKKKDIFSQDGYILEKLLALLGDKYRQNIHFPMDKITTDDTEFMQSYFSDYSLYNYRRINPVQADMGNFSRSDFSHITPHTKTLSIKSKKYFAATGVYALPGETITITRNDDANVSTKIFLNTLRSGSTHEFATDGYKRPKFLQTPHFEIQPHESISFTSPYGGIVEIAFDKNEYNTSFTFENIGEHPIWRSSADDAAFTQKMDDGDFDWAEIVTSGFEVHSTLEKMRTSINDPKWLNAQNLAAATKTYMSNYPHVLAGFVGDGIDRVDEIINFANDHNITMSILDLKKHMNADQATCGYGCSGNPYDAYWAFSPVAHGDLHELGHGLEKSQFLFEGFELHAVTNPYSYYSKSMYNANTGGDPDCQNLPFQEVFEALQASVNENNNTQYLKDNLWSASGWSQQVLVTIQAMMHTQKMGKLQNGWHLLARLHILQRALASAKDDWDNTKTNLGFDSYTLDEINSIRNNDWLLISFSFASELDFRSYFDMMGLEYTQKASTQVESFHYQSVPKTYFVSTPNGYCKTDTYGSYLDKQTLDVDGNTTWPQ